MVKGRQGKNGILVILAAALILAALAGPVSASWGKDQIQVTCYVGPRSDNRNIGTVIVYDETMVTSHCNMMYNDCDGKCIACYQNSEGQEICFDNAGRRWVY